MSPLRATNILLAAMILLGFSACSHGTGKSPANAGATASVAGTFGACAMDCTFDFRALAEPSPRVTNTYCRNATPSCITFEGVLTPLAVARLTEAGKALASANLEPHYGCGKCLDGTDNTLVLAHDDGRVTEHSYDAFHQHEEAPALHDVAPVLKKLHEALYACASNELIRIASDCVPYDELEPRPYARP